MLKNYVFQDFGHKGEFGDQPVIRESIRVKVCTTACLKAVATQPNVSDALNKSKIQGPIVSKASLKMREGRVLCGKLEILK